MEFPLGGLRECLGVLDVEEMSFYFNSFLMDLSWIQGVYSIPLVASLRSRECVGICD